MAVVYKNACIQVGNITIPGIVYDTGRFQAGSVFGSSFINNVFNPLNQTYQVLAVNTTGLVPDVQTDPDSGQQTAMFTMTQAQLQSRVI